MVFRKLQQFPTTILKFNQKFFENKLCNSDDFCLKSVGFRVTQHSGTLWSFAGSLHVFEPLCRSARNARTFTSLPHTKQTTASEQAQRNISVSTSSTYRNLSLSRPLAESFEVLGRTDVTSGCGDGAKKYKSSHLYAGCRWSRPSSITRISRGLIFFDGRASFLCGERWPFQLLRKRSRFEDSHGRTSVQVLGIAAKKLSFDCWRF